jgi:hypothetical protein
VQEPSPTLGDIVRRFAPALFAARGEAVTAAQRAVLAALGRCRTAALGGHVYRCDHCGAERIAYNACRDRHCPSCLGHKRASWLQARTDELLPVPYFHVVFTVPEEIAAIALGNKKVVYGILFRAVAETLRCLADDRRHLGAQIGFLAVLHTWTQTLLHHPHVHCVVPGGGLSHDGERWIPSRRRFFLPVKVLSRLFRGKFLALLKESAERGELRFAGATADLAGADARAAFLHDMHRKEWVVYAKPPFGSPEQVLKYLARYTHRVAISNGRIVGIEEDGVTFHYQDRKHGNIQRTMTLSGVEFLRRFLLHVLPKGFVHIRYFGFLAPRARAKLAKCRAALQAPSATPPPATLPASATTADAAADQDHRCPICGVGRLRHLRILEPEPSLRRFQPAALIPPRDTS